MDAGRSVMPEAFRVGKISVRCGNYGSDLFRRIYDKGTLYDPSFYKDECRTLENGTSSVRLNKTYLS